MQNTPGQCIFRSDSQYFGAAIPEGQEKMAHQPDIFLSPKLIGKRFEQHGLPLDVLRDFSVLDEMVKSVAKSLYKKDHTDRQRVPKNFFDDISLQIVGLEEGSTIVNIALVSFTACELWATPAQEYAGKARDCIVRTIYAAERGTLNCDSPEYMTREQMTMFERLGCGIQEGEAIEFPITGTNAKLNREVRRKLASYTIRSEYQESISVYGAISELDQDKKTFTLNTVDGQRIPVRSYNESHVADIMQAMNLYLSGQKVLLNAIGIFTSSGRLESLASIEDITLLEQNDFGYRLAEIAALRDGWMDGCGRAFDKSRLNCLNKLFQTNYTIDNDPYVFPIEDDLLQTEWPSGDWRMSMEINLSTLVGDFYALNLKTDAEFSRKFQLNLPEHWKDLCDILQNPEKAVQA